MKVTLTLTLLTCLICFFIIIALHEVRGTLVVPTDRKPACLPPFRDTMPFCNTSLSIDERVADLISRIKPEDKPGLMTARGWPQGNLTGIPYLGVPAMDNGLNCVRSVQSTCVNGTCPTFFANPTSLGASWNMSQVYDMAKIIGIEARALFLAGAREPSKWSGRPLIAPSCWSPNINGILGSPTWGRVQETPTEDPLISADYLVAYTLGMQKNDDIDPRYIQTVATVKHFAAYNLDNASGYTRYSFNAHVSPHDLAESFLPVFQAGVEVADAKSVMLSYNAATFPKGLEILGVPTAASEFLRDTLRTKWNFSGYTTSDTDSVGTIYLEPPQGHHYVQTGEEAVALALRNGQCDMNSGGTFMQFIPSALEKKMISEADLDKALTSIYKVRFQMGFFDPIEDQPFWNISLDQVNTEESKLKSYQSSVSGMVLLQNRRNTLPISKNDPRSRRIGVIGPSVNDSRVLLGNYIGQICPSSVDDFSCVQTICASFNVTASSNGQQVQCALGSNHATPASQQDFEQAIEVAKNSDVIILGVGLDQNLEAEMHDRTSLLLPDAQKKLIQAVRYANPVARIVMVLVNGGVLAIEEELPLVDAVLEAWYPGFYGAAAIRDVIFGEQVPAGRLPITMYYANYTQFVPETDMSMSNGLGRTYRYLKTAPLFPFGFGLSYFSFQYFASFKLNEFPNSREPTFAALYCELRCEQEPSSSTTRWVDDVLQIYALPRFKTAPLHSVVPQKKLIGYKRLSTPQDRTLHYEQEFSLSSLCLADDFGKKELVHGDYSIVLSNDGLVTKIAERTFTLREEVARNFECKQVF